MATADHFLRILSESPEFKVRSWSDTQRQLAATYLSLVNTHRASHRLTGITDPERLVRTFIIRPLEVFRRLENYPISRTHDIYDLGSGGGVPGIAMAIAAPNLSFVLVERSTTRAAFLKEVVRRLNLPNVAVYPGDAVELTPEPGDWIVTQGVNLLKKPLRRYIHRWIQSGVHLAWITLRRKAQTVRFADRPPQMIHLPDDPYVIALWL